MILWAIRGLFIIVGAAVAYTIGKSTGDQLLWLVGGLGVCGLVVATEWLVSQSPISVITSVVFGTLLGILLAIGVELVIEMLTDFYGSPEAYAKIRGNLQLALIIVFVYLCTAFLYRTRDKFRFIIPYVEFRREEKGARPVLLDTSVIVDGRITEVLQTRIIDGPIIVPNVVLQELHGIADSEDKLKRERGRLGLRVLTEIRENPDLEVRIQKHETDERLPVDEQLVEIAAKLNARIITNDFNLNRLATLKGTDVINLNELSNALKPIALPDEQISIKLLKHGEQPGQAIGYLEDGTMVVVEEATRMLGEQVDVLVTNTITRETGRMIFGKLASADNSNTRQRNRRPR